MAERVIYRVLQLGENDTEGKAILAALERKNEYEYLSAGIDTSLAEEYLHKDQIDLILIFSPHLSFRLKNWMLKIAKEKSVPFLVLSQETVVHEEEDNRLIQYMPFKSPHSMDLFVQELTIKMRLIINRTASQRKLLSARKALADIRKQATVSLRDFPPEKIIAIGASMGGVEAIRRVLEVLPAEMPGIVVVQHMPKGFTEMYAKQLDQNCKLKVVQACDRQRVEPGVVYVAPGDYQMEILKAPESGYSIHTYHGERVTGHRPSVNVMFQSIAKCAGKNALGVILTGMGEDGARGLLELRRTGANTIGQDEATSIVYGMPRVAFELGAVKKQLALREIPRYIVEYAYR